MPDNTQTPAPTPAEKSALMAHFLANPQTVEELAARMAEAIANDTDDFGSMKTTVVPAPVRKP